MQSTSLIPQRAFVRWTNVLVLLASLLYAPPATAVTISSAPVDDSSDVGMYTSLALNASGFPVMSYYDVTNASLKVAVCLDAKCSPGHVISTTVDTGNVGQYSSLALNSLGNPVISYQYQDGTGVPIGVRVAICQTVTCTSVITNTVDAVGGGWYTSLALDADKPVISYFDDSALALKVATCNPPGSPNPNNPCTGYTVVSLDGGDVLVGGQATSLRLRGSLPVVSYYGVDSDTGNNALRLAVCSDAACNTSTRTTVDASGDTGSYSSLAVNSADHPVIAYYDTALAALKVATCDTLTCTVPVIHTVDASAANVGQFVSFGLAADQPVLAYLDNTSGGYLKLAVCADTVCDVGHVISQTVEASGGEISLALNADDRPVVSHYDLSTGALKLVSPAPLMTVFGNSLAITSGDASPTVNDGTYFATDLGADVLLGEAVTHTFTISNSGDALLNLTGTPRVSVNPAGAFSVVISPTTPITFTGAATSTFAVRFAPVTAGLQSAVISIANDDLTHTPYTFTVQGTGLLHILFLPLVTR